MRKAIEIADYLVKRYAEITGSEFETSELKLQKMMYFIQRNYIKLTNDPLFDEVFEGWVHGPVLTPLRSYFENKSDVDTIDPLSLTFAEQFTIDSVIEEYGRYTPWALREFTHNEISWLNSRKGMSPNERGCKSLAIEDIRIDASKARIYDPQFDMYIDEFEDYDEEESIDGN